MSMSVTQSQDHLVTEGYSFDCFNVARTPREKRTFIAIATLVASVVLGLIIAVIVLAISSGSRVVELAAPCNLTQHPVTVTVPSVTAATCNSTKPETQCTSADCNLQAAELLYNLDRSVNPCDDFFKYSCGQWLKEAVVRSPPFTEDNPMLELQLKVTTRVRDILTDKSSGSDPALKKAVGMYNACMNKDPADSTNVILNVMKDVGGWPLAEGTEWDVNHKITKLEDIFPSLVKLREYTALGGLFTMKVESDYTNTKRKLIMLKQPPIPIFPDNVDEKDAVLYFISMLEKYNMHPDNKTLKDDVVALLQVNDFINNNFVPDDPTKTNYVALTIDDLTKKTNNGVNWLKYFNDVFAFTKKTFQLNDFIGVMEINYFKALGDYLGKFTPTLGRAIVNYEVLNLLRIVKMVVGSLIQKVKRPSFQQLTNSIPQVVSPQMWFSCATEASNWFSYALAPEYEKRHMNATAAVNAAKELTQYVSGAFREQLNTVKWLDEEARKAALQKLDLMKQNYNFPKWAEDKTEVNKYYEPFVVGSVHLENCLQYFKFQTRTNYMQINNDRPIYELPSSLTVNAFYHTLDNSINILQAIMQPPVFGADRLKVMNFGALGMVIGHEITHGFDTTGRQYDGNGNLADWMGTTVTNKFLERAKCFIDQYSQYNLTTDDLPGYDGPAIQVDGKKTVGENIADGGGIRSAYLAYKTWENDNGPEVLPPALDGEFTHDKVFFISYAHAWCTKYSHGPPDIASIIQDTHSPPRIRILGSLSNFETFSKTFNCPTGATMNPTKRCVLW